MVRKSVLLIAMSGVRIRNQRLLNMGMTLPGFVERGKVIASLPSLGLLTVAAGIPADWEVAYLEVDHLGQAEIQSICSRAPGLVLISALPARIQAAYRLADALRLEGKTVVLGGLHVSAEPEEASEHADAIAIGEAEAVIPALIRDYLSRSLARQYQADLAERATSFESGPVPRYDLLNPDRYNRLTIQTTRGCPLDCTFCGASRLISPYRRKSIGRIERELEAILNIWPKPFIELADDNTFVHKSWARDLVRLLKDHHLRWFTETDISVADDEELLALLAESGCAQLLIGLESVEERSLDGADTRHWKRKKRASYIDRVAKIQSYGISVNGCFALGFDQDDESIFERTRDFVFESGLSEVQITVLTPFPGTRLYRTLLDHGRLLEPRNWSKCTLFDVNFRPALMSPSGLEDGFHWLASQVYDKLAVAARKAKFVHTARLRTAHDV